MSFIMGGPKRRKTPEQLYTEYEAQRKKVFDEIEDMLAKPHERTAHPWRVLYRRKTNLEMRLIEKIRGLGVSRGRP